MNQTHHVTSIKTDRPTVLMGDAAVLHGGLQAVEPDHGAKRFQVTGWTDSDDAFTWQVAAEHPGDYLVTLLVCGSNARVQVRCNNNTLVSDVNDDWDRITLGRIHLDQGQNEIVLHAPHPGQGLELYSIEFISPALQDNLLHRAEKMRSDTTWMRKAKYGLQFHWTSQSQPRHGVQKPYNEAVRDFDVASFAQMVHDTGAGYIILTTSHAEYFFPAPIRAIDRTMPGRTTDRDLIRDLADALGGFGIRLMLYNHCGHGHWQEPDGWWKRTGFDPADLDPFIENWCSIISEVGERYGSSLAGWFFDNGCVFYPLNPSFEKMTAAAKAGNRDRLVCYNPWIWPRLTDFQDYFCGEGYMYLGVDRYLPEDGTGILTGGPQKGLQAHTNFILESSSWVHDTPNTPIPSPHIDKDMFVEDMKAAIARGIVPSVNMEIYQDGTVSEESMAYMQAVRAAVK